MKKYLLLALIYALPVAAADQWLTGIGQVNSTYELRMDPSANSTVQQNTWAPTTVTTTFASTILDGRKHVTLQNHSTSHCCVVFDPDMTPSASATGCINGVKLAASSASASQVDPMINFDYGSTIPIKAACSGTASIEVLQGR